MRRENVYLFLFVFLCSVVYCYSVSECVFVHIIDECYRMIGDGECMEDLFTIFEMEGGLIPLMIVILF